MTNNNNETINKICIMTDTINRFGMDFDVCIYSDSTVKASPAQFPLDIYHVVDEAFSDAVELAIIEVEEIAKLRYAYMLN